VLDQVARTSRAKTIRSKCLIRFVHIARREGAGDSALCHREERSDPRIEPRVRAAIFRSPA
jgi:hypothetical protein